MRVEVTQEDADPRVRVRGTGLETGVVNISPASRLRC